MYMVYIAGWKTLFYLAMHYQTTRSKAQKGNASELKHNTKEREGK